MPDSLPFTENEDANRLLASNPLAALVGMLLDQQFPMERAFLSPYLLTERLGGQLDSETIASLDDDTLTAVFKGPPALHRFPGSMGTRTRAMCAHLITHYEGNAASVWRGAVDGDDLYRRLRAIPGFGESKTRVFVGIIGKRLGEGPPGWESVAADWRSVADVERYEQILELREHKRAIKAAKKAKA